MATMTQPAGFYGATIPGADLPAAVPAPRAAAALATQATESAQAFGLFGRALEQIAQAQQPIKDAELSTQAARLANQRTIEHKTAAHKIEAMSADPTIDFGEVERTINAVGDTKPLWDTLNPYLSGASQTARLRVEGSIKQYEDGVPLMRQEMLTEARKIRTLAQAGDDANQIGEYISQGGTLQGALAQVHASIAAIDAIGLDGPKRTEVVNKYGHDVGRVLTASLPAGTAVSFLQSDAADFIPGTVRAGLLEAARTKAEQEALRNEARARAAEARAEHEQAKQQAVQVSRWAEEGKTPIEIGGLLRKTFSSVAPNVEISNNNAIAVQKEAEAKVAEVERVRGQLDDAWVKTQQAQQALDKGMRVEEAQKQGFAVPLDIYRPQTRVSPETALKSAADQVRLFGPPASPSTLVAQVERVTGKPINQADWEALQKIYENGREVTSPVFRAHAVKAYEELGNLANNRALAALDVAMAAMPGPVSTTQLAATVADAGGNVVDPHVQHRILAMANEHNVPIIKAMTAIEDGGGMATKAQVDTYWQHVAAPRVASGEMTLDTALHDVMTKTGMMPTVMTNQIKKAIAEQDTALVDQLATLPERDPKMAAIVSESMGEAEKKAISTMRALQEVYPDSPEIRAQKFQQFMAPHDATKPGIGPNLETVVQQTGDQLYQEMAARSTRNSWRGREVSDLIGPDVPQRDVVAEQARRGLWMQKYRSALFDMGSGDKVAQLAAATRATEFVDQRTGTDGRLFAPEVVYRISGATLKETHDAYTKQVAQWHILAQANKIDLPLPLIEAIGGAREKEKYIGRLGAAERIARDIQFVIVPGNVGSPAPAYYVFWKNDVIKNEAGVPMVYVPNRELAAADIGVQRRETEAATKTAANLRTAETAWRSFTEQLGPVMPSALIDHLNARANRIGQTANWWEMTADERHPLAMPRPEPLQ